MGLILTKQNSIGKNEGILFQLPLAIIYKIIEFGLLNNQYKNFNLKYSILKNKNKPVILYRPFFNARLLNKYWYILNSLTECRFCRSGRYLFVNKYKSNLRCNYCGNIFKENKNKKLDLLDDPDKHFESVRIKRLSNYISKILKLKENFHIKNEYVKKRNKRKKEIKYNRHNEFYKIF